MIRATDIKARGKRDSTWFVTAMVSDIPYQERFDSEPTIKQVENAVKSFEVNYAGLNESTNKPVVVKPHHTERGSGGFGHTGSD